MSNTEKMYSFEVSSEALKRLRQLYLARVVKLSKPAYSLVSSIKGSSSRSSDFFKRLFDFNPDDYHTNRVITHDVCVEVSDFVMGLRSEMQVEFQPEINPEENPKPLSGTHLNPQSKSCSESFLSKNTDKTYSFEVSATALKRLRKRYLAKVVMLSKPAYSLVSSIRGSSSRSSDFFRRLFDFNPDDYRTNRFITHNVCLEVNDFVMGLRSEMQAEIQPEINPEEDSKPRFKSNYRSKSSSESVQPTMEGMEGCFCMDDDRKKAILRSLLYNDEATLQNLLPSVIDIINNLSLKPRKVLTREFEECRQNVKAFYTLLIPKLYSQILFDGIGQKSYEETRKAIESIVNLVNAETDKTVSREPLYENCNNMGLSEGDRLQMIAPLILGGLETLPVRLKNTILKEFRKSGDNVEVFLETIKNKFSPDEQIEDMETRFEKLAYLYYKFVFDICDSAKEPRLGVINEEEANTIDCLSTSSVYNKVVSSSPFPIPKEIECLYPYYIASINAFPSRTKNILMEVLSRCNNSISSLYEVIKSPDFSLSNLTGCGATSLMIASPFLSSFQEEVESLIANSDPKEYKAYSITRTIGTIIDDTSAIEEITAFTTTKGFFPFFKTIDAIICSFPQEVLSLFEATTRVFENTEIHSISTVFPDEGRRYREHTKMRNEYHRRLCSSIKFLKKLFPEQLKYKVDTTTLADEVNSTEGTRFSPQFVNMATSILFPEFILVGDAYSALYSRRKQHITLSLFPSRLRRYIKLEGLIAFIGDSIMQKRLDDETIHLDTVVAFFLIKKESVPKDIEDDICYWCRYLLANHFGLDIEGKDIVLKQNKSKGLSQISFEALKDNGHAMTAVQLYQALLAVYPERQLSPKSIAQAIRLHPSVTTIGRSGTYSLKEWQTGEDRGGTIRSFVTEYLDSLPVPIASLLEVETYVKQFRPETNQRSIQYNLQQDTADTFRIYIYKAERYVGYSYQSYNPHFVPFENSITHHRPNKESHDLLVQFINKYSRFPSGAKSAPEEERRLARFYYVQRSNFTKEKMSEKEKEDWELFEEQYRMYHIRK